MYLRLNRDRVSISIYPLLAYYKPSQILKNQTNQRNSYEKILSYKSTLKTQFFYESQYSVSSHLPNSSFP